VYGGNQGPTANPVRLEGDKMYAATGFGYDDAEVGWHHCPPGAGICQGVRFEVRERAFISDIFVRPMPANGECEIFCEVYNCDHMPLEDVKLSISIYGRNFESTALENLEYEPITFKDAEHGESICLSDLENSEKMRDAMKLLFFKGANLVRLTLPLENARLWEPCAPYLYEAQVTLLTEGKVRDTRAQAFGMREFVQDTAGTPKGMFYLNGKSIRLRGANTMGYEQQDVLRDDFDALLYDMLMAKACNMNFLRLTQRPVQKEIYELCDTIGLMLQTDLPLFTVMRRTKFAEGVRQAEEMEKLIRSHASSVIISYMNEPMANAGNRPHRHFVRAEMEAFFDACDTAVRLLNPDRVIKHIDGDYDPPDSTMPDNHCYCTWYNGHGIDLGKLHRGYWLGVKAGWYYGCGEFGAEGLDPADLMRRRYPAHWLPLISDAEKKWEPGLIRDAQSGNMHFFYYDTQEKLEDWVRESRKYQALATKLQTEAFRRDPRMASIAIHLFIDAWPSGWMKTIVDCERGPKPAFFAYRDALTPLMVNLRTDRFTYFAGEAAACELFVCNDTHEKADGHKIICELISEDGKLLSKTEIPADFAENSAFIQGKLTFTAPEARERERVTLRALLAGKTGALIHYSEQTLEIFPREPQTLPTATVVSGNEFLENKEKYTALAKGGATVVIEGLPVGAHDICGTEVRVKTCGMRALHFVSRRTGHELVRGFEPYDFRYWYDEREDMITPILRTTFLAKGAVPILTSGNSLRGSAWGQRLYEALACAELPCENGKIIINQVDLKNHLINPVARIFADRLYIY
ncbi:MAG: glycoside hydrolase family 2, partial [Clostridia bacterium]|nr:glycoside hydrolase family 2 [Clostridia bacterium]